MHLRKLSANDLSEFSTIKEIRKNHQTTIYNEDNLKIKEQQRDSLGSVFIIYHDHNPVGTFRLVKTGNNLTLVERVSNTQDLLAIDGTWELGRFIIDKNVRSLRNIMDIYRAIALWLRSNPEIKHIVAVCNSRVAALLKRTGLEVLAKDIVIDNTRSNYILLSATVDDICKKLL